jgi:hypothetical protein
MVKKPSQQATTRTVSRQNKLKPSRSAQISPTEHQKNRNLKNSAARQSRWGVNVSEGRRYSTAEQA